MLSSNTVTSVCPWGGSLFCKWLSFSVKQEKVKWNIPQRLQKLRHRLNTGLDRGSVKHVTLSEPEVQHPQKNIHPATQTVTSQDMTGMCALKHNKLSAICNTSVCVRDDSLDRPGFWPARDSLEWQSVADFYCTCFIKCITGKTGTLLFRSKRHYRVNWMKKPIGLLLAYCQKVQQNKLN